MKLSNEQLKANRLKWIEALRSGEYAQCSGQLHDDDGASHCCYGVAAIVFGVEGINDTEVYGGLPKHLGIATDKEHFPMSEGAVFWNDLEHLSFPQIADRIELNMIDNRDNLFVEGTT